MPKSKGKKNPQRVITFDKSALRFICKAMEIPYNKNIIAFVKGRVITNFLDLIEVYDRED